MNKIKKKFKKYGYEYTLIARTDKTAIYSMFKYGKVLAYEVHKVRLKSKEDGKFSKPDGTIKVVEWPEREVLAKSSEFGIYGWSYKDKYFAMEKYKEIGGK